MRGRFAGAALALAIALSTTSAAMGAGPAVASIAAAAAERAAWGLSSDEGYVRAIIESGADVGSNEWGIVMTASEAESLDIPARVAFSADVHENLLPELRRRPNFAGAWFDQANQGDLNIAFTAEDGAMDAAIDAVDGRHSQGVHVHYVQVSFEDLEGALPQVWELWDSLVGGPDPFSVSLDEKANAVVVEVSADRVSEIETAKLSTTLGVPVDVTAGTQPLAAAQVCTDRDHCYNPMESAIWVRLGYSSTDIRGSCTMGFHIRKSSTYGFLTSGHCDAAPYFYHPGYGYVGYTRGTAYHNNGFDVKWVSMPVSQSSNMIYADWHEVTGFYYAAQGDAIAANLPKSHGIDYGQVYSAYSSYSLEGMIVYGGRASGMYVQSGDSGAPVYASLASGDAVATGVISTVGSYPFYARVGDALNSFGASLIVF